MGLFDFFGGSPAQKAQKLKPRVTQKYGDATTRQKAIADLADLESADTVPVLMLRFTLSVDPQSTDVSEKEEVFNIITGLKEAAVPHVVDFLKKNDSASSWAVKILDAVLPADKVVETVVDELKRLGAEYTRDPEKKEVLIYWLSERKDERIGPVVTMFLADMSDEVKIAAAKAIAALKYEPARAALIDLLAAEETAKRVQTACVQTLHDAELTVKGERERVEKRIVEPFYLDKSGAVKKRTS